jgi:hypothetical protein
MPSKCGIKLDVSDARDMFDPELIILDQHIPSCNIVRTSFLKIKKITVISLKDESHAKQR